MKRVRFPTEVKRGSSSVKIYRDRKPEGIYYRVVYYTRETQKGEDGKEKTETRGGITSPDLAEIQQEARLWTMADFRGRVMTLPHPCYD